MKEDTIVKLFSIISLLVLYIVDAFTFHIDHTITITIISIIAGIGGYTIGKGGGYIKHNQVKNKPVEGE